MLFAVMKVWKRTASWLSAQQQHHSPPLPAQLCRHYLDQFGEFPRRLESFLAMEVEGVEISALISSASILSVL